MSSTAGVRLLALLCCAAAVEIGCAQQRPGKAAPRTAKDEGAGTTHIVVGPGAFEGGTPALGAWLLYGSVKLGAYEKGARPPLNDTADDFDIEPDKETPYAHSLRILEALKEQKRLLTVPGGGHREGLRPDTWRQVDRQVDAWLDAAITPQGVGGIHQ